MPTKISSAIGQAPGRKPVSARACLIINQFATPGLGSFMAGRYAAGTVQLVLAVLGFVCFLGWFAQVCVKTYRLIEELPPVPERHPWLGRVGVLLFAAAWLLAWVTSLSLLREERLRRDTMLKVPANLPPKIRP
jgi:hypothetical protein